MPFIRRKHLISLGTQLIIHLVVTFQSNTEDIQNPKIKLKRGDEAEKESKERDGLETKIVPHPGYIRIVRKCLGYDLWAKSLCGFTAF